MAALKPILVECPPRGEHLTTVRAVSSVDVDDAVQETRIASESLRRGMNGGGRANILSRSADLPEANTDEIGALAFGNNQTLATGKVIIRLLADTPLLCRLGLTGGRWFRAANTETVRGLSAPAIDRPTEGARDQKR